MTIPEAKQLIDDQTLAAIAELDPYGHVVIAEIVDVVRAKVEPIFDLHGVVQRPELWPRIVCESLERLKVRGLLTMTPAVSA